MDLESISKIATLEFTASLPPRNITLFPDLRHNPTQSLVTLGLDS